MSHLTVIAIGLLAQVFFSARTLVQWIMSERAREVLSPSLFWVLSLAGSWLLCLYGWLRHDFAIVLGQCISYYVYIWNLRIKGDFARVPAIGRWLLLLTPPVALILGISDVNTFINAFFHNEDIPLGLLIFGSAGQIVFTLRFIYQWWYSSRLRRSELPAGFWILSLIGSVTILTYGCVRSDIVLILGQSFGLIAYGRNLWIGYRARKTVR